MEGDSVRSFYRVCKRNPPDDREYRTPHDKLGDPPADMPEEKKRLWNALSAFDTESTNGVSAQTEALLHDTALLRRIAHQQDALRQRIRAYEDRCQIRSDEVHAAIDSGRLVETEEVCDWIMDYELLQRSTR